MAITPITVTRIPRIQGGRAIVDANQYPLPEFLRAINDALGQIENSFNGINQALAAAGIAQQAAVSAQAAAKAASTAAASAASAASDASAMAAKNARNAALVNSYINPSSVVSATPTLVTIAPHTRIYGDGTSVSVNGSTVPATDSGDVDYVSYSHPTRAGGNVSYIISLDAPTQSDDIHVVGAVKIPSTGSSNGGSGPRQPGYVQP